MGKIRKSKMLGLSFPYDWSNPDIADDALIQNVLSRGVYVDICKIAAHYGLPAIEDQVSLLPPDITKSRIFIRMISNIKIGFSHAHA